MLHHHGFAETRNPQGHLIISVNPENAGRLHLFKQLGNSKMQAAECDETSNATNLQQHPRVSYSERILPKFEGKKSCAIDPTDDQNFIPSFRRF